jgi:Tol biopolymer transport system component
MTEEGASYFTWAPGGSRIAAFAGASAANNGVWVFDPNRRWKEQKPEFLTRPLGDPGATFFVNSWSPDGTRLVGEVQGTVTGILMYSLATRLYERLANFGEWPVFLPDDRHVLFVAGEKAFYVLDTKTKEPPKRVYSVTRDVVGPPRLARDGSEMYFSRRVTEADIWLVALR